MSVDYFKDTGSEGRDAIHSAIQRLQRDPDRDVRYFAGVEEDALDLAFDDHSVSSYHTAPEFNAQDTSSSPGEENELEYDMREGNSNTVEGMEEIVNDDVDVRTETLDNTEWPQDSDHVPLNENYLEATADAAVHEFEENERRLDFESEDAAAVADDFNVEEPAASDNEKTEGCTEERAQASDQVFCCKKLHLPFEPR